MTYEATRVPTWSDWLWLPAPALLAVAVAVVGTWLAWWQVRVAREKLRHDLFDRRFEIFAAVNDLLMAVLTAEKDISAKLGRAAAAASVSQFLLDAELGQYLGSVQGECFRIHNLRPYFLALQFHTEEDRKEGDKFIRDQNALLGQTAELAKRFRPYLTLDFSDRAGTGSTSPSGE